MGITAAIDGLSDRVLAYRFVCYVETGIAMPLELKGLKASMQKVAQRIERLNAKAQAFDALGADLETDLDAITAQIAGHGEDLGFAATVLGNSGAGSEGDTKAAPAVAGTDPTTFSAAGADATEAMMDKKPDAAT